MALNPQPLDIRVSSNGTTLAEALEKHLSKPKKWQWFPEADFDPDFFPFSPPPPPRRPPVGRWVWIPNPAYYGGCDACRESGVCMCVRPDRQIYC